MTTEPTLNEMIHLARAAGDILRKGYGHAHQVRFKGVIDLVTEVDGRSEDYLVGEIKSAHPGHMIITEESGKHAGDPDHCWYIDPLDGTVNYAHGIPFFCVSLAYARKGVIQLGVVYDPLRNECFTAQRGKGAWRNRKQLHVSTTSKLIESLLVTGFPYDIQTARQNNLDNYGWFAKNTQAVRRMGSAALDLCYVGAGRFDGYWELGLKSWDIAAGMLVVTEAGGLVTGVDGSTDFATFPNAMVAAGPALHPLLLEGLRAAAKEK
jgi:myo-inositol-1(or 4)-monophosphatase